MTKHLAIDVGAESGRVMLGSLDGGELRLREVHRFANEPVRVGSSLRWSMSGIDEGIDAGFRSLAGERADQRRRGHVGLRLRPRRSTRRASRASVPLPRPSHRRRHGPGARRVSGAIACMARPAFSVCRSTRCTSWSRPRESARRRFASAHRLLTIPDLINCRLTGRDGLRVHQRDDDAMRGRADGRVGDGPAGGSGLYRRTCLARSFDRVRCSVR